MPIANVIITLGIVLAVILIVIMERYDLKNNDKPKKKRKG